VGCVLISRPRGSDSSTEQCVQGILQRDYKCIQLGKTPYSWGALSNSLSQVEIHLPQRGKKPPENLGRSGSRVPGGFYWTGSHPVKGSQVRCRWERVVDSFAMKPEHVVCLISIKGVYSYHSSLCMYLSVQVSLHSLDTPPYPSMISRGVMGVCL